MNAGPRSAESAESSLTRLRTIPPSRSARRNSSNGWCGARRRSNTSLPAREKELNETFEPRIKARVKKAVDARMAKERMYSSPLTEAQLKTLLIVLHPDTRDQATEAQKDSAARILLHTRSRLVFKDRDKGSTYIPPDPAPEPSAATLRRCGLAIDEDGDLAVIDEEKFEAWLTTRSRPRPLIEGRAEQ